MSPRRRSRVAFWLLVALLFIGGATWRLTVHSEKDDSDSAKPRAPTVAVARRRSRSSASSSSADDSNTSPTAKTASREDESDWFVQLKRLVDGRADRRIPESILTAAGEGKAPGGGLHEILRRANEELAIAGTDAERRVAEQTIAWAIEQALRAYREDRALFAKTYREVRFGEGKLDVPGGSLVREFRFKEAIDRITAIRPQLQTECYDALALQTTRLLAADAQNWAQIRYVAGLRKWPAPPEPGSPELDKAVPGDVARSYLLPHMDALNSISATFSLALAQLFVDVGDPNVAAEFADFWRQRAPTQDQSYKKFREARLASIDDEIAALRELRYLAGYRVPATPTDGCNLADWFARRRLTPVAHAIGADGQVELGAWDDAMTKSWLENGLAWAPEQWQAERTWRAAAREDSRDGISGWIVESPKWETFSDVSADFSGESALVLEAAWGQAQMALGIEAWGPIHRYGARIFKSHAKYRELTHDNSGGEWFPNLGALRTFLDDPLRTDFDQFRYPTLIHEATHALVTNNRLNLRPWMNEGLACYVERWDPTRSAAVNLAATKDWVRRPRTLQASRDAGTLPTLDALMAITKWAPDDFGPITLANYAAAESLFVYLADDPAHWKLVGDWLNAAYSIEDTEATITDAQRAEISKGWRELVDFECGRLQGR